MATEYRTEMSTVKVLSIISELELNQEKITTEFFTSYITLDTYNYINQYLNKQQSNFFKSLIKGVEPQIAFLFAEKSKLTPHRVSILHLETKLKTTANMRNYSLAVNNSNLPINFIFDFFQELSTMSAPIFSTILENKLDNLTQAEKDKLSNLILKNSKKIVLTSSLLEKVDKHNDFFHKINKLVSIPVNVPLTDIRILKVMKGRTSFWRDNSINIIRHFKFNVKFLDEFKNDLNWKEISSIKKNFDTSDSAKLFIDTFVDYFDIDRISIELFSNNEKLRNRLITERPLVSDLDAISRLFLYPDSVVSQFIKDLKIDRDITDLKIYSNMVLTKYLSFKTVINILRKVSLLLYPKETPLTLLSTEDYGIVEEMEPDELLKLFTYPSMLNASKEMNVKKEFIEKFKDCLTKNSFGLILLRNNNATIGVDMLVDKLVYINHWDDLKNNLDPDAELMVKTLSGKSTEAEYMKVIHQSIERNTNP